MAYKKVSGSRTAEIQLDGSVYTVDFGRSYNYYAVRNDSDDIIYISTKDKSCTPSSDGVVSIPSGGGYVHYNGFGGNAELYILGNGSALIIAQDDGVCPFKSRGKGGDNSFSGDYNDLTNKPDIPVPSEVIDSNSTNETVSTSKAVFDYVISMLASAGFKPLKVDKLPEVGSDRILYLLPKDGLLSENLYDEYLWIDGVYEPVGTTAVDLSNYATVDDLSTKQDMLVSSSEITDSNVDWNNFEQKGQNGIFVKFIGITGGLDDNATHGLGGVYGYGVLMQIWLHSATYQIYLNDYREIYTRTKYQSAWRSWTRLDFNGRPISDPTLDWNTLTSNGIYTIGYNGLIQEESHGPAGVSGWGVLTVTNTGLGQNQTACILQKYESPASGIYYRSLWNSSGDWSPWYKISSTAMTN